MRLRIIIATGLISIVGLSLTPTSQAVTLEWGDIPGSGEAGVFLSLGVERPKGLTMESISGVQFIGTGKLLIPGKSAEISCFNGKITEGSISNEYEDYLGLGMKKGGHGHGTALFTGCSVQGINAKGELTGALTKCTEELNKGTSPPGEHNITVKGLLLVRRHEGLAYLVIEPPITSKATDEKVAKLEAPLTTLTFGGICVLPEKVNITGGLATRMPIIDDKFPSPLIDTFTTPGKQEQELLGLKLKFGANEAFVQGEADLELTGSGKELLWGAM